jgi:DNA modification methylase
LATIRKSLESVGGGRSILVDGENIVRAGNGVFTEAQALGLKVRVVDARRDELIAVRRKDLKGKAAVRAAMLDNLAADSSAREYDADILAAIARDDDVVAQLVSDDSQIAALVRGVDKREEAVDAGELVDRAVELQKKWRCATGEIWTAAGHFWICGDCRDAETWARLLKAAGVEKVNLVVTSPPYAVGKEYEAGVSFSEHIKLLCAVADRCIENTIAGGFIFTNFDEIAAQSHSAPLTGSKRQCLYLISKDYWRIFHEERKCDLYAQRIWYKPFNRLQQPFWSYKTSIPHYQEWEHIWTWRTPGGSGDRVCDWDISVHAVWDTRQESTDDKPLTRHVAAFPVCLPERAIKAHTLAGDVVIDPFLGSGTTIVAAHKNGRRGLGIEQLEKYCAVICERIEKETGETPKRVEENGNTERRNAKLTKRTKTAK